MDDGKDHEKEENVVESDSDELSMLSEEGEDEMSEDVEEKEVEN